MNFNQFNISFNNCNISFYNNNIPNDFNSHLYFEDNPFNIDIFASSEPKNIFSLFEESKHNNKEINIAIFINDVEPANESKLHFQINKELPKPCFEKEISLIFKKMKISKEMKLKFISSLNKTNDRKEELKEKISLNPGGRLKKLRSKNKKNIKKIKEQNEYGRKKKTDNTIRCHNKFSCDNLINKIINIINSSLILFCNKVINSIYKDESRIKQIFSSSKLAKNISGPKYIKEIDYKLISKKKKGHEILKLLDMNFKEYLSNRISSKFCKIPLEYNKLIINQLLADENNKDIFNFIFNNISIEEWLSIYIYEKEFEEINGFNSLNKEQKQIIKKNIVGIQDFFTKIYEKDETYFQCLVLLIYNFKRFLSIKEERNRIKKK